MPASDTPAEKYIISASIELWDGDKGEGGEGKGEGGEGKGEGGEGKGEGGEGKGEGGEGKGVSLKHSFLNIMDSAVCLPPSQQ